MTESPNALWEKALALISENVSEQQYNTWFKPIAFESFNEQTKTVLVQVPSPFVYEYLEENFVDLISKVLRRVFGSEVRLEYHIVTDKTNNMGMVVESETTDVVETPMPQTRANQSYSVLDAAKPQEIDSQLNPHQTFDNFIHKVVAARFDKLLDCLFCRTGRLPVQLCGQSGIQVRLE